MLNCFCNPLGGNKAVMYKVRSLISCRYPVKQLLNFIHSVHLNPTEAVCSRIESNRVLNELSKSGHVDEARQMFDKMPEKDEFSWNTLIAGYANSGRFSEAKELFHDTPVKSSIAWSSLISGYCKYGFEDEAFELFWEMQFERQRPSQYTLGSVLRLCSTMCCLLRGEQIHGYAMKIGLDGNVFVVTGLIDMYTKCYCIVEAEYLFEVVAETRNHATWTAMLTGYSHNGEDIKAIEFFRDMRLEGVESNQFTFPSILTACAASLQHNFGVQVHGCTVKSGFDPNVFVQSALIDMYTKCGDLSSAERILENLEVDDAVSWNSMIAGCAKQELYDAAISLFKRMRRKDLKIDNYTYPSMLKTFAALKDVQNATSVHCMIIKAGFGAHKLVNNALVDMYAKQGKLGCAFKVFNLMEDKDVISWTSLITGYLHNGFYQEAIKLFCDMRLADVYPDQVVVASVLSACSELTLMEFGRQLHALIMKYGLRSSLSVDNSLVTLYAKCGSMTDANRVFDFMLTKDVISWTALIIGYAQNGRGKESLLLYDQMITAGTKPDFITFVGLLFACSHAGLVEDGRCCFDSMQKVYGIKPGPEHFACMIDLLGRSGNLGEATGLLNKMVIEPDATVWKAVLAACRVHGEVELGESSAQKLFELEPMNAVPYIMLSNIYSKAGRWEDAATIRRLLKSKGLIKEPGCSWIETKSKIHTFMSEDRRHHMTNEIYSKVDEIITLIKKDGYVPDMNFALQDMDEEGKELGLAYHSEKLAVAFGLLTIPQGAPIRIFKNLRVCGDCHTAMKYISSVYLRHIILRDSNCFHHFREGKCSCGDYW